MGSSRARHSTRAARAHSRSVPPTTASSAPEQPALGDVVLRLEIVRAVIVGAVHALRHQNCDIDADIALALQRCASDALSADIEALRRLGGCPEGAAP